MNVRVFTARNKSVVVITRGLLIMGSHTGERMPCWKRNKPGKMLILFAQGKKERLF